MTRLPPHVRAALVKRQGRVRRDPGTQALRDVMREAQAPHDSDSLASRWRRCPYEHCGIARKCGWPHDCGGDESNRVRQYELPLSQPRNRET